MRYARISLALMIVLVPVLAQEKADGPTNDKAQKTYKEALNFVRQRRLELALEAFKKADKQDAGHCLVCRKLMIKYGTQFGDWKAAELGAGEMVAEAQGERDVALAHFEFAAVFMDEGLQKHKEELFQHAHEEIAKALAADSNFPGAWLLDGRALAHLHQDDAAKARFEQYVQAKPVEDPERQRVLRFVSNPELARARMAPPFSVTTADGGQISMDELQGKVVLLDFWATWCAPCRAAVPHIKEVAKKFQGQPLVILSVSLDRDEQKWKEFIGKNEMTWPQYRDGDAGAIAKKFGVAVIPHTFTIDADGLLQEEHIGDADIEGKLRKLLARARELQSKEILNQPI